MLNFVWFVWLDAFKVWLNLQERPTEELYHYSGVVTVKLCPPPSEMNYVAALLVLACQKLSVPAYARFSQNENLNRNYLIIARQSKLRAIMCLSYFISSVNPDTLVETEACIIKIYRRYLLLFNEQLFYVALD